MSTLEKLEIEIAEKIRNYRKNDLSVKMDEKHVDTWVTQFEENDRLVILQETNNILNHCYFDSNRIEAFFEDLWNTPDILGINQYKRIPEIQFLNIQTKGNSQKLLLDLLNSYYQKNKSININFSNHSNVTKYIYIDDCMYTGETIRHNLKEWLSNNTFNNKCELDIIFLAFYTGNYDYNLDYLQKIASDKGIKVNIYRQIEYNNILNDYPYDFLWPCAVDGDTYVDQYIEVIEEEKRQKSCGGIGFRKAPNYYYSESELFTSSNNRMIYEQALMKAGSYIYSLPQSKSYRMRPMGFSSNISLGFDAFFVTCYNISNNCPLALWWGDSTAYTGHPFSKWYPLFPRKTNTSGGDTIEW